LVDTQRVNPEVAQNISFRSCVSPPLFEHSKTCKCQYLWLNQKRRCVSAQKKYWDVMSWNARKYRGCEGCLIPHFICRGEQKVSLRQSWFKGVTSTHTGRKYLGTKSLCVPGSQGAFASHRVCSRSE
jgi:hypothetical protein